MLRKIRGVGMTAIANFRPEVEIYANVCQLQLAIRVALCVCE